MPIDERKLQRMVEAMFSQAISCFVLLDRDGRYVRVNEAWAREYGRPVEHWVGRSVFDIFPRSAETDLLDVVLRTKQPIRATARPYIFPDDPGRGVTYWDWVLLPIFDERGEVEFFFFSSMNATERVKAAARVEKLSRLYATLSHASAAIVRAHDRDELFASLCDIAVTHGQFVFAWVGMLDEASRTVLPRCHAGREEGYLGNAALPIDEGAGAPGLIGAALRENRVVHVNDYASDPRVASRRAAALARGYRGAAVIPFAVGGRPVGVLLLYVGETDFYDAEQVKLLEELSADISHALESFEREARRLRAEGELRRLQALLNAAERIAQVGGWDWDIERNAGLWTEGLCRILGRDGPPAPLTDERFVAHVHPEDRALVKAAGEAAIAEGRRYEVEHRILRPDGQERIVESKAEVLCDDGGRPTRIIGAALDVTQQRRIEEILRRSQKLDAVGQLTAGIAHDFNNLLMVISGNLEQLEDGLVDGPPELRRVAGQARDAAYRGADLSRRLLTFARQQTLQPIVLDANRLLTGVAPLLHRTLGENIAIETLLAPSVSPIVADEGQVENALLNLAVNARDAMPNGGRLRLTTANFTADVQTDGSIPEMTPGDYVTISISDTGVGMTREVREHAFEPFFTTKEVGKGTGLGLSMVYGFVKESGGHVLLDSAPGRGTTITLYFPRAPAAQAPAPRKAGAAESPRGSERILLVEDDEMVRVTLAGLLGALGYSVESVGDGAAALASLESERGFDVLLTDMIMPGGMSGWDVAQAAWRRQPELKVLFSTGYSDQILLAKARASARARVLQKPYNRRTLATALRELIDGG
jgi:PAS domain S-box-containing protein